MSVDDVMDKQKALKLKEFLIDHLEKEFDKSGTNVISLKVLIPVIETIYEASYFLRNFFKLDSRSLLKRLHMFLLIYPQIFYVDCETELVRFATYKESCEEGLKNSIINRCCDFILLILSLQPKFLIPIKQLHHYLAYSATDVKEYLNDEIHLRRFLKIYPDLFNIENDHLCLASKRKEMMEKRVYVNNESTQMNIENKLIQKISFIVNIENGKRVANHVLSNVKVVAIDSEGTHLGNSDGILTLVQIAFVNNRLSDLDQFTITDNVSIYFFDILKCPDLVMECIEPILTADNIVKVYHDSRNDLSAVQKYGVNRINKVFDTSKNYLRLTKSVTNGLHTIYEELTGLKGQNLKPKIKQLYCSNYRIWEQRPLNGFLKFYAAFDVLCLITIYMHLEKKYEFTDNMYISKTWTNMVYSSNCVNFDEEYNETGIKKKKKKKKNKNKDL